MTTPENTPYEQIRLNYIARKLEELSSPREITIASIRYQEQAERNQRLLDFYIDKVIALKEKLNAIQAIINQDQTQE